MGERRHFWDDMTPEQQARCFRFMTPEQFLADVRRRGLDITCTNEQVIRNAAAIYAEGEHQAQLAQAAGD